MEIVSHFLLLFEYSVMDQRVHDKPIDFSKETTSVSFLFRYNNVAVIVDDVTGQIARAASPSTVVRSTSALKWFPVSQRRLNIAMSENWGHFATYPWRNIEKGLAERAISILEPDNSSGCFVASLLDKDGMRSSDYTLVGYSWKRWQ